MTEIWIIRLLILSLCINLVCFIIILKSKKSYQKKIYHIANDLRRILDDGTDEKVMFFTDDKALIALNTQINRILDEQQKTKAEYCASQLSEKRMLSNISHDIRTPMTVIQGYVEMLLINDKTDMEVIRKVDTKVKQVTNMIEEFFTLTKLESGDYIVDFSRVHCNEICKSCIIGFYDILSEKGFDVDIDIPEQDIFAYADKVAVERVLNNLISNAVRYGYEGNFLQIKLYETGNYVFIDVMDKGKGIDHIISKCVFDRLYTVDDSRNKLVQGNGLGLTIAKQLSQKMGGDLTLESTPYVKTVFTLKLKKYEL